MQQCVVGKDSELRSVDWRPDVFFFNLQQETGLCHPTTAAVAIESLHQPAALKGQNHYFSSSRAGGSWRDTWIVETGKEGRLPGRVRRSEPWTIRVSQLLPEKTFRSGASYRDSHRNLEGLSETKEISEASAQINLTCIWHNVLKMDKLFQRKPETPPRDQVVQQP